MKLLILMLTILCITGCQERERSDYWLKRYLDERDSHERLREFTILDTNKAWELILQKRKDSTYLRLGSSKFNLGEGVIGFEMRNDTIVLMRKPKWESFSGKSVDWITMDSTVIEEGSSILKLQP